MIATSIRLVTADATEAARINNAEAISGLAADVNAAAEAFGNIDRALRRYSPDPIVATDQSTSPQRSGSAQQHAGSVHGPEPRRFSLLGFLAGVTLAAATGVLVYLYLRSP